METMKLTKKQARRFLLRKHGLLGGYRFSGKQGALEFIRQAGCIQFDPVDVCGKNAELVLQSRVNRFTKRMLSALLYEDRALIDYFDKNLSIFPMEDWPYFARCRERHRQWERSHAEISAVRDTVKREIAERGPCCSADIDLPDKVSWYWSDTKLSRAALEHLYFTGELCIHHKSGAIKYYDLIENCVPQKILLSPDPYPDGHAHLKWRVLRRIGAVGLLWNRASDAWLNIDGLNAAERTAIFCELLNEGKLTELAVEGVRDALYMLPADFDLAQRCLGGETWKKRCEFIAPLDNLLWDRKLIRALFDFDYKWEIYTPANQRKYGHYVLPILCGEEFIGRIEAAADRKAGTLLVKNIWYEPHVKPSGTVRRAVDGAVSRLAAFNLCKPQ
ncbi:MAG TPA: crosslink repair DNA glycosylase YcaQ family protein [Feifaniaceae bacterium]|nr:crosslink repair DNA glycosylase YcaQ family protein [Feifaniaceae bacterium]